MNFIRKSTLDQLLDISGSNNKSDNKNLLDEFDGYGSLTGESGTTLNIDGAGLGQVIISGLTIINPISKFITIYNANNINNNGTFQIIGYNSILNTYIINNSVGVYPDSNSGNISWDVRSSYSLEDDINFIRTDRKLIKGTLNYFDEIPKYRRATNTNLDISTNLSNISGKTTDAKTLIINKLYKNINVSNLDGYALVSDLGNLKHSDSINITGVPIFDGYDINNYDGTYVEIIDPLTEAGLEVIGGIYDGYRIFGRTFGGFSISPNQVEVEFRAVSKNLPISTSIPFIWNTSYLPSNIDLYIPYRERLDLIDENSFRITLVNGIIGDAGNAFIAGGDLSGDNRNQKVIGLQTVSISPTLPINNDYLKYNGSQWIPSQLPIFAPQDATYITLNNNSTLTNERVLTNGTGINFLDTGANGSLTVKLADTTVSPGSYTYSSITVDQQGRLTAASSGITPAPVGSTYLTLSNDPTLTNERVLTAGTGISFNDTGPNGTLTINNTGAPVGATYLTLSNDATLTNERVLNPGTNITFTDGGADGYLTINSSNGITWANDLLGSTNTSQTVVTLSSGTVIPVTTGLSFNASPAVTGNLRVGVSSANLMVGRNSALTADVNLLGWNGTTFTIGAGGATATSLNFNAGTSGNMLFAVNGTTFGIFTTAIQSYKKEIRWAEDVNLNPHLFQNQAGTNHATSSLTISAQSSFTTATGTNKNAGSLQLGGGTRTDTQGRHGGTKIALNNSSAGVVGTVMIEATEIQPEATSLSRVVSLFKTTTVAGDTTSLPTGTGDLVLYIANCNIAPTVAPGSGGILFVQNGVLKYIGASGVVQTIAS